MNDALERAPGLPPDRNSAHTGVPAPTDFEGLLAEGFARRIGALSRLAGAAPAAVAAVADIAAAVSRATAAGHVCIQLAQAQRAQELGRQAPQPGALALPALRAMLLDSGVVCDGTGDTRSLLPLVIDADQRVYLARYYDFERQLARALIGRTPGGAHQDDPSGPSERALETGLEMAPAHDSAARLLRFFGAPVDDAIDWQRVAAALALGGNLTIISGGPGTGKTTTVVGILACLLDQNPVLRIALAAPTGKAAQRMQEALHERARQLPPELAARLPRTSYTLHRLLGSAAGSRLRHTRDTPLPYDVVIVDEASMIDVALAAQLVDAVAPHARLVLLGDKDQLAAVEAGAVFAELSARPALGPVRGAQVARALGIDAEKLAAAWPRCPSPPAAASLMDGARNELEEGADAGQRYLGTEDAAADNPLIDCVVWLERNYRFGLESPIGRLAAAIRNGLPDEVLGALARDPREPAAAALYDDGGPSLAQASSARLAQGFSAYAGVLALTLQGRAEPHTDPAELFEALNRYRVLCAMRAGPRGVDSLNTALAAQVRRAAQVAAVPGTAWFAGRPVMVTRNDYALGLFNGDTGIALPGAGGALRVVFRDPDGTYRAVAPAALPPHDTAFALTVHKSQGSEFEHVALVMPAGFNRILTRELIYTAVTRARARVAIFGAPSVLAEAVATPTHRASGLAARLGEAARERRVGID